MDLVENIAKSKTSLSENTAIQLGVIRCSRILDIAAIGLRRKKHRWTARNLAGHLGSEGAHAKGIPAQFLQRMVARRGRYQGQWCCDRSEVCPPFCSWPRWLVFGSGARRTGRDNCAHHRRVIGHYEHETQNAALDTDDKSPWRYNTPRHFHSAANVFIPCRRAILATPISRTPRTPPFTLDLQCKSTSWQDAIIDACSFLVGAGSLSCHCNFRASGFRCV